MRRCRLRPSLDLSTGNSRARGAARPRTIPTSKIWATGRGGWGRHAPLIAEDPDADPFHPPSMKDPADPSPLGAHSSTRCLRHCSRPRRRTRALCHLPLPDSVLIIRTPRYTTPMTRPIITTHTRRPTMTDNSQNRAITAATPAATLSRTRPMARRIRGRAIEGQPASVFSNRREPHR